MLEDKDVHELLRGCAFRWLGKLERATPSSAVIDKALRDLKESVSKFIQD